MILLVADQTKVVSECFLNIFSNVDVPITPPMYVAFIPIYWIGFKYVHDCKGVNHHTRTLTHPENASLFVTKFSSIVAFLKESLKSRPQNSSLKQIWKHQRENTGLGEILSTTSSNWAMIELCKD